MNTIQTIRVGACAFAAACALGACTQPTSGPYGAHPAPPAPPDGRGAQSTTTMPDANTRYDPRPSPGNTMPPGATVGEPVDVPPPGPNGTQGDQPLPGTPPPMQY
ncbi:hypothetical protein CFB46_30575 [Burkholderia sp. HI2761]|uniref:hypothetical protein n=1 Tax=Burkholderia TaxID=32008 RepID=UPI0003F9306F|nr:MULTISPECIES: hypothetical protein [Burkholderia]MPV60777.1 hypothetical protein [Burkholderia sp. BE24]OXJ22176.1 hypothetical protein CFB46_30575 [Burkholderia sp. HI2761]